METELQNDLEGENVSRGHYSMPEEDSAPLVIPKIETEAASATEAETAARVASESPEKPRGRPFEKGNPGRPRGSKNKRTLALEALLDGQAEAITETIIAKALEGERAAMRLCFERILPPKQGRTLSFELPVVNSAKDAAAAMTAIIAAVAAGEITPGEATTVAQLIDGAIRAFEVRDFAQCLNSLEKRIAFIEKRHGSKNNQNAG
jgi:hypothetical protein